jgi:hypothetical protein
MGCSEVGRSRLKRRTPSGLASNHRLPIGHIIVEIEIDGWGGLAQRRRGAEGEWGGLQRAWLVGNGKSNSSPPKAGI